MAKKHWIYVKRGLTEDPKHRARMGECIWLYLHIIDKVDWETGIVYDWTDAQEAEDMTMPATTMRNQRRKLEDLGYISHIQRFQKIDIVIHNWTSPRDYGGKPMNLHGDSSDYTHEPDHHADHLADHHPALQTTPLTSDSISESLSEEDRKFIGPKPTQSEKVRIEDIPERIGLAIQAGAAAREGREDVPGWVTPVYAPFYEVCRTVCGEPAGTHWTKQFDDFLREGIGAKWLQPAADKMREGGMTITRPRSLLAVARDLKQKPPEHTGYREEARRMGLIRG